MLVRYFRNRAEQPIAITTVLALVLAVAYLLGATNFAYTADATVDSTRSSIPHEVQRSGFLVVDLNGDNKKEMVFGSVDGYLTVVDGANYQVIWDKNLVSYMQGFPRTRVQSSLATADLDGDGKLEIVVATGGDPIDQNGPGAVFVFNYVGGGDILALRQGWPVYPADRLGRDGTPDGYYSSPSLGDIDGDGRMEIVIGGMDRAIHAYHDNGTNVAGWPLDNNYRVWRESRSTAALVDLDNDGILDVLIGSNNYVIPSCANPYIFYGVKGNTVPIPGYPISTTQNIESSPAIGDINGDSSPDVVFGTGDFDEDCGQPKDGHKVYALDRFGQPLPGWPVHTNADMVNSPALGDLDHDGVPEVVIHTVDSLYAWHGDGSLLPGFPTHGEYNLRHASPVLADVDGDSDVEIVLASGQVYGPNGQLEQMRQKLQSQVVVTDQDGDGRFETIGTNNYNYDKGLHLMVFVYQETGAATSAAPWPMFHRSMDRNGVLPFLYTLTGRIVDESNKGVKGAVVTLDSGETAVSDQQGIFFFSNLPPGHYVATPKNYTNPFVPKQQSVDLATNATMPDFVMKKPIFDINGKVMNPNGSPLRGVTLRLDGNIDQTSGGNGAFSFKNILVGSHTVKPVSPNFVYLPADRKLNAEDMIPQFFYALPKPVTQELVPGSENVVDFDDTQGLPTSVTFPEEFGGGEAKITPIMTSQPQGYVSTGHTMEIELSDSRNSAESVVGQDGEPLSIQIKIKYNNADLQAMLDDEELVLLWQSPNGWVNAQATCPSGSSADLNTAEKTITVPVCQWGVYGLFGPVNELFIPTVINGE